MWCQNRAVQGSAIASAPDRHEFERLASPGGPPVWHGWSSFQENVMNLHSISIIGEGTDSCRDDRRDHAAARQTRAVQEADRRMTAHNRVNRWISDLLASAIVGALGGLLLDLLASWIAPKYWGPASWDVAVAGAVGGMLSRLTLRRHRQSENSK